VPLARKYPIDDPIQRSLMLALQKRAELHVELKEHEQTLALYRSAVEIGEQRVLADPRSTQAKRDLAMTNKKYAQALDAAGDSRASLERLQTALRSFQELAVADPVNTEHPYDVANTRHSIGETHLTLREHEPAMECFLRAKDEFAEVLRRNPANTYAVRMLSYNFDRLAKSYAAMAEKGSREDYLRQAIENWRAALDGFERLKASGKLGEMDANIIAETQQAIATAESSLRAADPSD
jgi:tetratricopeptide (TPR) repeat protein